MRRIAAVTAIVLGVALIATPIASSLFSRSRSAHRLANDVRPAMSKRALATAEADKEVVKAAVTEFTGPTLVEVSRAYGQSPRQFSAFLQKNFPDVAAGARVLPGGVAHGDAILKVLEKNRARFASADSFPIKDVSVRLGPWIFVAIGLGFAIVGLLALAIPGRAALAALLVLGLVPVVFAFAASLPQKASDSNDLVDALKPTLSERSATRAVFEVKTAERFVAQLGSGLLPALAKQQHVTPTQLDASLKQSSPAVSRALPQFNRILAEFDPLAVALVHDRHVYDETSKIEFRTLVWLLIGASCLVLLAAALALFSGSQPRSTDRPQTSG
jgi:hypothetical protein